MARTFTAAAFVKHNMPLGQGRIMADQDAIDVAADRYRTRQRIGRKEINQRIRVAEALTADGGWWFRVPLLTFLFLAANGVLFGYFLARRARSDDPIEAMGGMNKLATH